MSHCLWEAALKVGVRWGVVQFDKRYEGERRRCSGAPGPPNPDVGSRGKETFKLRSEDKEGLAMQSMGASVPLKRNSLCKGWEESLVWPEVTVEGRWARDRRGCFLGTDHVGARGKSRGNHGSVCQLPVSAVGFLLTAPKVPCEVLLAVLKIKKVARQDFLGWN